MLDNQLNNKNLESFITLHNTQAPLVLFNAWDAASAHLIQLSGAKAVATSSAAIAWSRGYADDIQLPKSELISAVKSIMRGTSLPVTVDIENGYSEDPAEVANLVFELQNLGIVGINIEDGLDSPQVLVEKIRAIRNLSSGQHLFINARTDVLLRSLETDMPIQSEIATRLLKYNQAGADCGFIPGLVNKDDIQQISDLMSNQSNTMSPKTMPLNIMLLNNSIDIDDLFKAGITRFSAGPALFLNCYDRILANGQNNMTNNVNSLFSNELTFETVNAAF